MISIVFLSIWTMAINLFQNAKILGGGETQPPHAGFHPIFIQDPKDFLAGTSVEGWTLHWKLDLFVCFLWWLCKIEVLNILPQSPQGSLLLDSWFFRLKMPCHIKMWSIIHSNNLYRQIIPVFGEQKLQNHIENHRIKSLIGKFNPLHLSQLKNLLNPGLI